MPQSIRKFWRSAKAPGAAHSGPPPDRLTLGVFVEELRLRRIWVVLIVVWAVVIGLFVANRQYGVKVATADILVDTPSSQVVDLGAKGAAAAALPDLPALASRARLLGNLMASGPLKREIATAAGVPPDRLVVVPPADAPDIEPRPVEPPAARNVSDAEATVLKLTTDANLPILRVSAQAPAAATAEALATEASKELENYIGSVANNEAIPTDRQLVVESIGTTAAVAESRGPSTTDALLAAGLFALLGCASVGVISFLLRRRPALDRYQDGFEDGFEEGFEAENGLVVVEDEATAPESIGVRPGHASRS